MGANIPKGSPDYFKHRPPRPIVLDAAEWEGFERGLKLFRAGEYWEAHEAWEGVWLKHPEPERLFLQGLILLAAAFHQQKRGIYKGATNHLRKALGKLEPFQPEFLDMSVTEVVNQAKRCLRTLERLGPVNIARFDTSLIPRLEWSPDQMFEEVEA